MQLTTHSLGSWTGVFVQVWYPLINVHFHASPTHSKRFVAVPLLWNSFMCSRTTLTGERISTPDGELIYAITMESNCKLIPPTYFRLRLSDDGLSLRGVYDLSSQDGSLEAPPGIQVVLKRTSMQAALEHYPSPDEFAHGRPRALWRFAISSVLHTICSRGTDISWKRVVARRSARHRLASILYLQVFTGQLPPALSDEGSTLMKSMQPADVHFTAYASIEPSKFPWLLPACSVQGPHCQTLLPTTTPCLRCCSPHCIPQSQQYASHGCVICENPQCLEAHDSTEGTRHCVVRTHVQGWTIGKFEQATGKGYRQLRERAQYLQVLLATDRGYYMLSRRTPREPSQLATIAEWDEDLVAVADGDLMRRSSTNTVDSSQTGFGRRVRFHEADDVLVLEPEEMEGMSSLGPSAVHSSSVSQDLAAPVIQTATPAVDSTSGGNPRECLNCKETIKLPCWTCAECAGE